MAKNKKFVKKKMHRGTRAFSPSVEFSKTRVAVGVVFFCGQKILLSFLKNERVSNQKRPFFLPICHSFLTRQKGDCQKIRDLYFLQNNHNYQDIRSFFVQSEILRHRARGLPPG